MTSERASNASVFLASIQNPPPHCASINVILTYDDGMRGEFLITVEHRELSRWTSIRKAFARMENRLLCGLMLINAFYLGHFVGSRHWF